MPRIILINLGSEDPSASQPSQPDGLVTGRSIATADNPPCSAFSHDGKVRTTFRSWNSSSLHHNLTTVCRAVNVDNLASDHPDSTSVGILLERVPLHSGESVVCVFNKDRVTGSASSDVTASLTPEDFQFALDYAGLTHDESTRIWEASDDTSLREGFKVGPASDVSRILSDRSVSQLQTQAHFERESSLLTTANKSVIEALSEKGNPTGTFAVMPFVVGRGPNEC